MYHLVHEVRGHRGDRRRPLGRLGCAGRRAALAGLVPHHDQRPTAGRRPVRGGQRGRDPPTQAAEGELAGHRVRAGPAFRVGYRRPRHHHPGRPPDRRPARRPQPNHADHQGHRRAGPAAHRGGLADDAPLHHPRSGQPQTPVRGSPDRSGDQLLTSGSTSAANSSSISARCSGVSAAALNTTSRAPASWYSRSRRSTLSGSPCSRYRSANGAKSCWYTPLTTSIAACRARAADVCTAPQQYTAPRTAPSGRPSSTASALTRASDLASCSGVYMYGSQTSPNRAARRMAAGLRPPSHTGGPGRCTAGGCSASPGISANRPWWVTRSPASSPGNTASASSARAPRSRTSTPAATNSGRYSPPTPTPKSNLPPDTWSRLATSLASTTSGYTGTMVSALSKRIRSVPPAAAANATNPFAVGPWKNKCSPMATWSNPAASAQRASVATFGCSGPSAMPTRMSSVSYVTPGALVSGRLPSSGGPTG